MADTERNPATSAGTEQVEERDDALNAGPTAADETPSPGAEQAGADTTAAPPEPSPTHATELQKRMALLNGEAEPEQDESTSTETPEPAAKAKEPEPEVEPEAGKPKEPPELSEDVRKRMPKEAAKAFAEMRHGFKEMRTKIEAAEKDAPAAEFGRALYEEIGPAFNDLQTLETEEIREAIRERAAIKRGEKPKANGIDADLAAKLEGALKRADETLDLGEIRELLKGVTPAAPTAKPATTPAATRDQAPAPQQPSADREAIQVMRTRTALLADGIKPDQLDPYVRGRLLPKVLDDIKASFPGKNPAAVFNAMDAADRTQLLLDQHRLVTAQTKKAPSKPPTQRTPLSQTGAGRTPSGGPPASNQLSDRLAYLNGE
jgi:hypothetical protein